MLQNYSQKLQKKVDQACTKGVIVKNTAARKKSNMAKKLNSIAK